LREFQIVMKHATGARALRFVRKLPLLKGLSDNVLFDVAERMTEEEYEDGEALIKYGERGHKLFLIRYGRVDVQVPLPNGEKLHVNTLGRGHFVGERTLITNKLRSADCFAHGPVTVRGTLTQKLYLSAACAFVGQCDCASALLAVLIIILSVLSDLN
jgi:cGMP-dependent protein kinase